MNQNFYEEVKKLVMDELGNGYQLELLDQNSERYQGKSLLVKKNGAKIGSLFHLDYVEDTAENYASHIVECTFQAVTPVSEEVTKLFSSMPMDRILMRFISQEGKEEFLSTVPHRKYLDLAIIYYLELEEPDESEGRFFVTVTNSVMEYHHLSEEELYEAAMRNNPRLHPGEIIPMETMLMRLLELKEPQETYSGGIPMVCIGFQNHVSFGSVAILQESVKNTLAETIGDCILLPCDKDTFIAFTDKPFPLISQIKAMVQEINRDYTTEKDFLSNSVYFFDAKTKEIRIAG